MNNTIHVKLGEDRRLALPAKLCKRHGLDPGDRIVIEETETGLRLNSFAQVLREVQAAFAPYRRPGVSVVDELIAERRRDFELEEAKFERLHGKTSK